MSHILAPSSPSPPSPHPPVHPAPTSTGPLGQSGSVFYFGALRIVIKQRQTDKVAASLWDIRPIPKHIGLTNEAGATFRKVVKLNRRLRGAHGCNVVRSRMERAPGK